jgi:large subunit ribosomal protein L24
MPTKPRTQRKALYGLKLHERRKLISAHVSKELKEKLKTAARSIPMRKGDRVKVMRGSHKGKTGKVSEISLARSVVFIEGIMARKAKGGEVPVPFHPSNLLILEADFSDKERKAMLSRKRVRG